MTEATGIKELFGCDDVYDYFNGITRLDHPSGNQNPDDDRNEDPVRAYVISEAKKLKNTQVVLYNEKATELGKRDIVLLRPGMGNYKDKKPIILQGHMDMVCNPDNMKFPLNLFVVEKDQAFWLKAKDKTGIDSTLGADDGIGVATALALLKDESLEKYPIECLFTVQEETDMGGAMGFDIKYLTGDKMLNLDSENLPIIVYGSAGGCDTKYTRLNMPTSVPSDMGWVKLGFKDLKGGHSGIDINKHRLNAIKALAAFLAENLNEFSCYLQGFDRLDSKTDNSIPAEACVVVGVQKNQAQVLADKFNQYASTLKDEEQLLKPCQYQAEELSLGNQECLDIQGTQIFINILNDLPTGVILEQQGLVITSTNLFQANIKKQNTGWDIEIGSSNRSSDKESFAKLLGQLKKTGEKYGFTVNLVIDSYPMWQPDDNSQLLKCAKEVYSDAYGDQYKAEVIHAGLECAVFVEKYKDAGRKFEAVALGPTIQNPHTPNEVLLLKSAEGEQEVKTFYNCVKELIEKLMNL